MLPEETGPRLRLRVEAFWTRTHVAEPDVGEDAAAVSIVLPSRR